MRFLMFNLVVSAALIYLVLGEEHRGVVVEAVGDRARDAVVTATDAIERMIDPDIAADDPTQMAGVQPESAGEAAGETPPRFDALGSLTQEPDKRPIAEAEEIRVGSYAPSSVIEREPLDELPIERIPIPSSSAWFPEQPLIPVADPAVVRRRAEVLGIVARGDETRGADTSAFMNPKERQRDLHALAEEMELLFANALTR